MASKKMTPMAAQKAVKKAVAAKKAPAKTTANGGKVSSATLAQLKKDGMEKAIFKVATYKASPEYATAATRMYGAKRIAAVHKTAAAQKITGRAGKGGKNPDGMPEAFIKGTVKAVKNIPNIPGAGVKAIKKKITGK